MSGLAKRINAFVVGLLGVMLLCIPAVLNNRSPILYSDSRSYYVGGRMVIDRALSAVHHLTGNTTDTAAVVVSHAKAVRSIYYSALSYLLADHGTLWAIILAQSALAVWMIAVTIRTFKLNVRLLNVMLLMTLFSTLPWVVSMFMPDIFTALMVLSLACLLLGWDDLSRPLQVALLVMFASSIVMHITNLPIAIALLLIGFGMQRRFWRSSRWLAIKGAIALAVLAMLFVGVVGFGKWSIAPQNPPFLLARSLADGPAKLYLREHCPQIKLVMCRYVEQLDDITSPDDFIWGKGIFNNVTPEVQDALRLENSIAVHAALEHPWLQLEATARNFVEQLYFFDLRDTRFPNSAQITSTDLISDIHDDRFPDWLIAVSVIDYIAVILSAFALIRYWSGLTWRNKQLVILLVMAVLLNAVAGAASEPAARYGARIIWLLPLTALLVWPREVLISHTSSQDEESMLVRVPNT